DESVVAEVRRLHEQTAHKRRAPPGPDPLY
ncbi:NAD(+) synthetase, partial [Halobacteriales archaeon QH_6_68_27]